MDKAGITVSAAHTQMTTAACVAAAGGWFGVGNGSKKAQDNDADALIASKCQMLAQKGFEPIQNVFSLNEW